MQTAVLKAIPTLALTTISYPCDREGNSESALQPLRHSYGIAGISDIFQQDGVFVATEPGQSVIFRRAQLRAGNGVHLAQRCGKPLADLNQHFVSDVVPQAVVKNLEFVDIDEQDSEFVVGVALGEHQRALQTVEEKGAVGKIGQAIVEGVVRQHFFRALAFADVAVHDHQLFGLPFRVPHGAGGRFQDAPGSVLMAYPVFHSLSPGRWFAPCAPHPAPAARSSG